MLLSQKILHHLYWLDAESQRLTLAIESDPGRLVPCNEIDPERDWCKSLYHRLYDNISDGFGVVRDLLVAIFGNDEAVAYLGTKLSRDRH